MRKFHNILKCDKVIFFYNPNTGTRQLHMFYKQHWRAIIDLKNGELFENS